MTGAILLAGGKGSRLGGNIPKQYIKVAGKMIIEYSLDVLIKSKEVDTLVIVAKDIWHEEIRAIIDRYPNRSKFVGFSLPGKTRQRSIYNALKYMREFADDEDSVLIHDAARPNLTEGIIKDLGNAIKGHDGVMPVLAMKDTVYMSDMSGHIVSLLDKQFIVAGQAPEQFMYGKYLKANEDLDLEGRIDAINGATETAILAGMDVITIPGYEKNYKITTSEDLARFCEKNNESMEIN